MKNCKESGAVSEETAKTLEEAGVKHPNFFSRINRNLVRKIIEDYTLVAITIMIAESKTEEKETLVKLVMNFLKGC